jgi:hypothetical protein
VIAIKQYPAILYFKGWFMMSITFDYTIIHVLDATMTMPVLSTKLLVLNDEIEAFITKHILKVFDSPASSKAYLKEGTQFMPDFALAPNQEDFYTMSCELAQKYFAYITEYGNIPSGDLLMTYFTLNERAFTAILKLNYKEAFTHYVETTAEGIMTKIIKHKGIFPTTGKQVDEAIIIDMNTFEVVLLDQSKANYLPLLYNCETSMSIKETLQVIEDIASEIIEAHYDNTVEALSELKNNISESLTETQTIPIQKIIEKTFGKDKEVYEQCIDKLEEAGLDETTLEVSQSNLTRKFASHKLKTDMGIELKFPVPIFNNTDYIEFINNPDGTLSIMLKNISQITNQ